MTSAGGFPGDRDDPDLTDPDGSWTWNLPTPSPVKPLLERVVRSMGAPGTDAIDLVFNRWDEVVGEVLAQRTRPAGIDDGCLVLEADDPAVVSHVRWLEADLVAKLGELLGEGRVTSVQTRVRGPGRRRSKP